MYKTFVSLDSSLGPRGRTIGTLGFRSLSVTQHRGEHFISLRLATSYKGHFNYSESLSSGGFPDSVHKCTDKNNSDTRGKTKKEIAQEGIRPTMTLPVPIKTQILIYK